MDSLRARAWGARAALAAAVAAVVVLCVRRDGAACGWSLLTVGAAVVVVAAGFWFLQQRGVLRWLALASRSRAPWRCSCSSSPERLLWVALVAVVLLGAAVLAARARRCGPDAPRGRCRSSTPAPPQRPFLVMNPRSGGGKVARFGLQQRAEALGAEVALLDRPEHRRPAARPRRARPRGGPARRGRRRRHPGAGGAGRRRARRAVPGDQRRHPQPLRPRPRAWTGRTRPAASTPCATGWRRGSTSARSTGGTFVNNASFGAYAEIVENPAYRDDKRGTALDALPDLLQRPARRPPGGARGRAGRGRAAGAAGQQQPLRGHRPRRDGTAVPARPRLARGRRRPGGHRAAGGRPARGAHRRGLVRAEADEVVVNSGEATVPVGIDGETVHLTGPVRCRVRPVRCGSACPASVPGCGRRGVGWTGRCCGDWRSAGRRPPRTGGARHGRARRPTRLRPAPPRRLTRRRGGGRPGPVRRAPGPARRRGRPRRRSAPGA